MEKKLTDEEVVKALEYCQKDHCEDCPYFIDEHTCKANTLLADALDLIHRLQAENERLTEENGYLDGCAKQFLADYQKCEIERAEIQKQVDELKENQVIECHGMLKGCDMVKQAVKDTAKEIFDYAKGFFTWDEEGFVRELKEFVQDYGVEVE